MEISLAGDHMKIAESADGSATITFDDVGTGRRCGDCQLCCRLVPVPTIGKGANVKCQHQRVGKGCMIYAVRPMACRTWACRWLADPETAGMPRPDRCHYVIDLTWDFVTLQPPDGGQPFNIPVAQVWIDPAFRSAYRAPELRAFMLRTAEKHGAGTICRFSRTDAITVFPPPVNAEREWIEMTGSLDPRNDKERAEALALGESI